MNRRIAVAMATGILFSSAIGMAQTTPPVPGSNGPGATGAVPGMNRPPSTGPKPYADVITAKAKTDKGLFTTHRVEDKYYFEIPDSLRKGHPG